MDDRLLKSFLRRMGKLFDRRFVLKSGLSLPLIAGAACQSYPGSKPTFYTDPFTLGVASGDPLADGVVIWTRLAPDPFDDQAIKDDIKVGWEVSENERFDRIVRSGQTLATAQLAHSVHIEVTGLRPDRHYFYRFIVEGIFSPTGRTRTAPIIGARVDGLRFALASCQSYSEGYYGAYRGMGKQAPDLVVHVGDYIYTTPWTRPVRRMPAPVANDLQSYRAYHAAVKTDPDLQAAHAVAPWLVIWDDHEVFNDYRNGHPPVGHSTEAWLQRRRAAYQAYYEHMPVRRRAKPQGNQVSLYQRAVYGDLAQFDLLDTRQFRSNHPCPGQNGETPGWSTCDAAAPQRTMLGTDQEEWFNRGFGVAGASWNFIIQTTQMTEYLRSIDGVPHYNSDRWDAYPGARQRLFERVRTANLNGTVFLGGDIHAFFASDLRLSKEDSPFATELVVGAISSGGGGD